MPTNRTTRRRRWSPELSDGRKVALLLGIEQGWRTQCDYRAGYGCNTWEHASEEEKIRADELMRADWAVHGDHLLRVWIGQADDTVTETHELKRTPVGGPGTRPRAWWLFDAPDSWEVAAAGRDEDETAYLRRRGLLLPGEAAQLDDD